MRKCCFFDILFLYCFPSFVNRVISTDYQTVIALYWNIVNSVLDLAERMANRHIPMTMEDWAKRIDIILEAGGDAVLHDAGKISAEFAKSFAESEFEKYRVIQDKLFSSDFDIFNSSLPFDDDKN